jgi:hypothetical protein
MVARIIGSALRAIITCLVIYYPATYLPGFSYAGVDIYLIFAGIAGTIVWVEYMSRQPSMIEFRLAPPYNRFRLSILVLVTVYLIAVMNPYNQAGPIFDLAEWVSDIALWVFPIDARPVSSMLLAAGITEGESAARLGKLCAGGLFVSFVSVILFSVTLWLQKWPLTHEGFNLWPNMPSFTSRAGRKTELRMLQIGLLSLILALTYPYVVPQLFGFARLWLNLDFAGSDLTLFWGIVAWSVVPAVSLMRCFALWKIAFLIDNIRKLDAEAEA